MRFASDIKRKLREKIKNMAYTYKYPRPAVTADCIVITKEAEPKVLLIERGGEPFKGCWALPGGFMNMDETTEQCAFRELEEETGLKVSEVHQIGAYSRVDRDPRGRTITVAYLAVVDAPMAVIGQDDAAKAQWFPLSALPELAFDHDEIMRDAIKKYKEIVNDGLIW
jgi:8-oxo-dGTP diphosphatase